MSKATPRPWAIRPQELDDWGIIRGSDGTVACVARPTEYNNDAALHIHRKNKTDPTQANANFIVKAVNAHDRLVAMVGTLIERLDIEGCGASDAEKLLKELEEAP